MEQQHSQGHIDLFFADETRISEEGYAPYGWQFDDEDICVEAARGRSLNCFGLLSRQLEYHGQNTESMINADFILRFMDDFSLKVTKITLVVFDNAAVHKARKIRERFEVWQKRGLYIFFLPSYSPHSSTTDSILLNGFGRHGMERTQRGLAKARGLPYGRCIRPTK